MFMRKRREKIVKHLSFFYLFYLSVKKGFLNLSTFSGLCHLLFAPRDGSI